MNLTSIHVMSPRADLVELTDPVSGASTLRYLWLGKVQIFVGGIDVTADDLATQAAAMTKLASEAATAARWLNHLQGDNGPGPVVI